MQFQKLTQEQSQLRKWRLARNHLVQKILDEDRHISREDALKKANRMMRKSRKKH